jgi:glyoxylase I family protein
VDRRSPQAFRLLPLSCAETRSDFKEFADMFNRVHHIAIICSDYEKSKHFYTEVLGFEAIREIYRQPRKSYKLDLRMARTCNIELFSFPDPPQRVTSPEACGLRHIAFEVEDIESVAEKLRAKHVLLEPIRTDELTGKHFTFFRDPDGLPIEIYER